MKYTRSFVFACLLGSALTTHAAFAQDTAPSDDGPSMPLPDVLNELDRHADQLSDQARDTVEEFVKLVGPMLDQLSLFIKDLPTYHAPEVLPNGDIIIRRKHEGIAAPDTDSDEEIET